jgi:hypothetical protein
MPGQSATVPQCVECKRPRRDVRESDGRCRICAYLTSVGLAQRGWTKAMIAKLLGEPDELAVNPHYKSGPPMKLYDIVRVEAAEATAQFAQLRAVAERRSAASRSAAEKRRAALVERAASIRVTVPHFDREVLFKRALRAWERRRDERLLFASSWDGDISDPPPDVERLAVNFLRHECTHYERWLDEFSGQVGAEDARWVIREAVYAEIARVYPYLADECRRQIERRKYWLAMAQSEETA